MNITCPHCSQTLELTPEVHAQLQGQPHFACPLCQGLMAVPPIAPPPPRPALRQTPSYAKAGAAIGQTQKGMSRNMRVLGIAALLLLGVLAAFLAMRGGNVFNTNQNIQQIINNQFFQNLITSGKTSRQALEEMADIQADGEDFVGVSRDKLTWQEAQDLAKRTSSQILTIEPVGNDLRKPHLDRLTKLFPVLHGLTSWVSEEDLPTLIDSPDLAHATTPERPRQALFQWFSLPEDKRPWVKIKSTTPASPHAFNVGEWVRAKVEYNNPGPNAVRIWVGGSKDGRGVGDISDGSQPHQPGKGEKEGGFALRRTGEADVIRVTMVDDVTKQTLLVTTLPVSMEWKRDDNAFDIELISVKPPSALSPAKELRIPAKAGQRFKLDLTAKYKTPTTMSTKLASNLLMREANILPPEFIAELSKNHSTTWHFDTQSRPGYKSVFGQGEISFDLTGYAPKTKGTYTFNMNLGLFDSITWDTIKMNEHKVTLEVTE